MTPSRSTGFLAELRRRNVFRMAGLYLVGAWLIIQVAETLLPAFDVPGWFMRAIIIVLALGFVPALLFSWVFELTPDGLKRDHAADPAQPIAPRSARRMDQLTLVGVLLVLGAIAADRLWPERPSPAAQSATAERLADTSAEANTGPEAGEGAIAAASVESATPSVAVLPFVNLSSDPEQEYFSDGMTEEILNVLAKVRGLKVAARTSVFEFKNRGGDVREIGVKLGVSHVIEGSVRRDADQIRVTAQLIRVADGFHVWSESYDRKLEGIFALQDDLAQRVGEALQASFGLNASSAPRISIKPEAYDAYLKGRSLLRNRTDILTAIAHFERAVSLEPAFGAAWAALSLGYDVAYWYVEGLSGAQLEALIAKQGQAAEQAAAIDPGSATVQHALGNVARKRFHYTDAERHYLEAMRIDPSYPDVREDYSELLFGVGRTRESRLAARQLVQLDPYFGIGWVRVLDNAIHADVREEVEEAVVRLRELLPEGTVGKMGRLAYAITWGRTDEARLELAEGRKRWPEVFSFAQTLLPWALEGQSLDEATYQAALAGARTGDAIHFIVARGNADLYDAELERSGATMQGYYFSYLNDSVRQGHALLRAPQVKSNLVRYGFVDYWREKGWPEACRPLGREDFECGRDAGGAR
jgi:TolB-like protein